MIKLFQIRICGSTLTFFLLSMFFLCSSQSLLGQYIHEIKMEGGNDSSIHPETESSFHEIDWLNEKGNEYLQMEKIQDAEEYFLNALSLSQRGSYSEGLIDAKLGLSRIYASSHYDLAVEGAIEALSLAEELKDEKRIYLSYITIGAFHLHYNNNSKALEYFDQAEVLRGTMKDSVDMTIVYHNKALRSMYSGEWDEAKEAFKLSVSLLINSGQYQRAVSTMNNMGLVYKILNMPDSNLVVLTRALSLSDSISYEKGKVTTGINLAITYNMLGQYEKTKLILNEVLILARSLGDIRALRDCHHVLYQTHKFEANFDTALHFFEKYKSFNDSVMNLEVQQHIAFTESNYQKEKDKKEIELLEQKSLSQRRLLYLLIIVLLFMVVLGALSIRLARLKNKNLAKENIILAKEKQLKELAIQKEQTENKKKQLENDKLLKDFAAQEEINRLKEENYQTEIEFKNNELTSQVLHIASKNEFMLTIKEELIKARDSFPEDSHYVFRNLISELDKSLNIDKEWQKFIKHFEEVHKGFINRLLERSPELTHNELRLCAYLHINLSSKEIATMLNISPTAVEKRRQRLRKKLNLQAQDNLVEFLQRL